MQHVLRLIVPKGKRIAILACRIVIWMPLVCCLNCPSPAQPSAQPSAKSAQPASKPPKKRNKDLPENHAEKLKDFAETPGLPRYSDKCKFVEGVVFPAAQSGPSITMKFLAKAKPADVLAWYQNAFNDNKWTVEQNATQANSRIGATKDKDICRVVVTKHSDPKFKTMVILTDRIYRSTNKQTQ